jgi:tetratricopeptide (TPR) repeat protein
MNSDQLSALVRTGLEFHRMGQIEQAGRIYGEVLERNAIQEDALHLFGLVLYQLGEPKSAVAAVERAIALSPGKAHFHANLAEIDRSLGHNHRAIGSLILALRLRPDRFASSDDFDLVFLREGQFDNLEVPPSPALELASIASLTETQRASKRLNEGDVTLALDHFLEAVRLAPVGAVERFNLGGVLLELKRLPEALHHCQEAVRLNPALPEAWNRLGQVYHAMGQSVEARSSYLESLRLDPKASAVLNNLGRVLADAQNSEAALIWFQMALKIEPDSVAIRSNTAWILREIGQIEEASTLCQETIGFAPNAAEIHVCHGSILHDLGRFEEARKSFERALELKPDFVLAHQSQGILLTEMGEWKAAEQAFRELLRYQSNHSRAHFGLANLFRGKLPETDLASIHRSIEDPTLPDFARAELHFASATVYDAREEFGRAADHLRQANRLRRLENARSGRGYRAEDHEHFVERMMEVCSKEFFDRVEGFGLNSERPVFVIGLPRSGTSLTEQDSLQPLADPRSRRDPDVRQAI